MTLRMLRWSRRALIPIAGLTLLQTTGCDPAALAIQLGTNFTTSITQQVFSSAVSSLLSFVIQTFPSADLLRIALGITGS